MRIDPPAEARTVVIDLLNTPHFIALHELYDKLYTDLVDPIDDIAQRITALGGGRRSGSSKLTGNHDFRFVVQQQWRS